MYTNLYQVTNALSSSYLQASMAHLYTWCKHFFFCKGHWYLPATSRVEWLASPPLHIKEMYTPINVRKYDVMLHSCACIDKTLQRTFVICAQRHVWNGLPCDCCTLRKCNRQFMSIHIIWCFNNVPPWMGHYTLNGNTSSSLKDIHYFPTTSHVEWLVSSPF